MSFRFQFRRGTTAERNASNPILAAGEPAVVLDSGQPAELVLGDGVTAMADLRAAVWDDDARLALADTAVQPGDDAADLGSAAANDGYVLTADGAGGAAWSSLPASDGGEPDAAPLPITLRRGTTAEWAAANPVLSAGEPGVDTTTGEQRIGDGVRAWSALPIQGDPTSSVATEAAARTAADQARIAPAAVVVAGDSTDLVTKVNATTTGTVFVPRGTYAPTATLAPRAGVTVRGEGELTVIRLPNSGNRNVIDIPTGYDNVTIRDLVIDGNRANQSSNSNCVKTVAGGTKVLNVHAKNANGYNIVAFPGATDFTVQGCTSEGSRDDGIEVQGTTRATVVGNIVRTAGTNGIYVYANTTSNPANTCTDVTVTGNVVQGSSALQSGYAGIRVDDTASYVTVANNVVTGGGSGAFGISVTGPVGKETRQVTVTGNAIRDTPGPGIAVDYAIGTTVTGNVVSGSANAGISIAGGARATTATGNTVSGCSRSGVLLFNAQDFVVTGNICRNNGQDQAQTNLYNGITLWNSSGTVDRGVITDNRCYDDQGTKTQQYGIRTLNTIGASVVIGRNIVDGNGTTGQAFSFGGATAPSSPPWKLLSNVSVSSTGNSIPHGLPYAPTAVMIYMRSAGTVWRGGGADATSVVLISDSGTRTCDVWVG